MTTLAAHLTAHSLKLSPVTKAFSGKAGVWYAGAERADVVLPTGTKITLPEGTGELSWRMYGKVQVVDLKAGGEVVQTFTHGGMYELAEWLAGACEQGATIELPLVDTGANQPQSRTAWGLRR